MKGQNKVQPIYLDYNATTPVDPAVLEAMLPYLQQHFGNPSSNHAYGLQAHVAVEHARAQVAGLLGCTPDEIVFTSGGSEADNLAIKGICTRYRDRGNHVITTQVEHPAVIETCRFLERHGYQVTYVPVDRYGMVDSEEILRAITPRTILITIMHAQNEVGTIQPLAAIGEIARSHQIAFHTDAAQSAGKIPVRVDDLRVDALTVAGHKLYAPKGIGALYVRHGLQMEPLVHGAGHESGRRAGTENVAGIVGLGEACHIAGAAIQESARRVQALRDDLHQALLERGVAVTLNGHPVERLPNTLNLSFLGTESQDLLAAVPEIAASAGSACHSGTTEPSPVLVAMGLSPEVMRGAVRLSLGRWTTAEEVTRAGALLSERLGSQGADSQMGRSRARP